MEIKKNPLRDVERRKSSLLITGLVAALSFVLVAFEWTTFDHEINLSSNSWSNDLMEEEIVPISRMKAPPPPPPPVKDEPFVIVEELAPTTEPVEVSEPIIPEDPVVQSIAAPVEIIEEEPVLLSSSVMPEFTGGEEEMYRYLKNSVRFPAMAKESGISGAVYVTFVVDTNGAISEAKVLHGIGGGCDEEALRVIRNMPLWKPGIQNGKPVKVRYNMPIRFTLKN